MLRKHLHVIGKVKNRSLFHPELHTWLAVEIIPLFTALTLIHTFQLFGRVGDPIWPSNTQGVIQLMSAR